MSGEVFHTPIMTPVSDQGLALATMIEAMRAQTEAITRQSEKVDSIASSVAKVREDIAVMQVRDEQFAELRTTVENLKVEIISLKMRNAQQDGGVKTVTFLKEWGPWLLAFAGGVYAVLVR